MNKLKLLKKALVIVIALFFTTPMLHAFVIIEDPEGNYTAYPEVRCCEDWGALPSGWDCHDNC